VTEKGWGKRGVMFGRDPVCKPEEDLERWWDIEKIWIDSERKKKKIFSKVQISREMIERAKKRLTDTLKKTRFSKGRQQGMDCALGTAKCVRGASRKVSPTRA